jgi:copper chaperone CopZ
VRVSLKAINGVDAVDVSLKKGLATVTMKPGNTATLKQLQEAISKNGFSMKQTEVVVRGVLENDGGKYRLKIAGTSDVLNIKDAASADAGNVSSTLSSMVGKQVEVTGTLPEGAKGKAPDSIHIKSVTEVK